jgi:hypothetical protein
MFLSQQNAEHCIEAIDTGLKGVETQLDSLARQIAVLDDEWNGEAKEAFAEAMSEWTATVVRSRESGTSTVGAHRRGLCEGAACFRAYRRTRAVSHAGWLRACC